MTNITALPGGFSLSIRGPLLAEWSGPGFTDHLNKHDNVLGGVSWQEESVSAQSLNDRP